MYNRLTALPARPVPLQKRLNYQNLAGTMLVPPEDRTEFEALVEYYKAHYRPGNFVEDICVVEAISHEWSLRRVRLVMSAMVKKSDLASLLNTQSFRLLLRHEEHLTRLLAASVRSLKSIKKKAGLVRPVPPGVVGNR